MAIKRCAVEGAKKMGKKSISRGPARKAASHKRAVTGSRLISTSKKRASADLLQMSLNNQEECSFSELELFKRPVVQK